MDIHWFLIMVASPIIVLVSVFGMFVWGANAKTPSFLQQTEENSRNN